MTGDGGDLELIEDNIDHSCRVESAVVFVDEKVIVDVHEALLRCTRILVRVGEIGKYSISESSVDKVTEFGPGSRCAVEGPLLLHPATQRSVV